MKHFAGRDNGCRCQDCIRMYCEYEPVLDNHGAIIGVREVDHERTLDNQRAPQGHLHSRQSTVRVLPGISGSDTRPREAAYKGRIKC